MLQPERTAVVMREHEASYRKDVLELDVEGEQEEDIDRRLIAEAKELGLSDINLHAVGNRKQESSRPAVSAAPAPNGSDSTNSRQRHSTGLLSNHSRESHSPRRADEKSRSKGSLFHRDYESFLSRGRDSISSSRPSTASPSVFSLPVSLPEPSPKKHYRILRGLSMLKLHRVDSALPSRGCPHCLRNSSSQGRVVHKLPCGHRLCTEALRNKIRATAIAQDGAMAACCGIKVPNNLVQRATMHEEQGDFMDGLERRGSIAGSAAPSARSEARSSHRTRTPDAPPPASRKTSDESKVDSVAPESRQDLDPISDRAEFQSFRRKQARLRDRFDAWVDKGKREIEESFETQRNGAKVLHEAAREILEEHHADAMAEAEDKQVKAEADIREIHAKEAVDNATALRHMEAYCAGTFSSGESHGRTVTAQDYTELDKARRARDSMASKHSSAINVLRGEQAWRIRLRSQRQEKEVQVLEGTQERELLESDGACAAALRAFEGLVVAKRRKLEARGEMQKAILVKKVELETGAVGEVAVVEWGEPGSEEARGKMEMTQARPGADDT